MAVPIAYHTRHIPPGILDFAHPTGRLVRENGLCDVTEPANLRFLKEQGVGTVELRLVWWELETAPGVFAWERFDRDVAAVEAAGLKPGLMAWFNHPPAWYWWQGERAEGFRCLEHGEEISPLSLWDPRTLGEMDRLYAAVAQRYGRRLDFVYVTSCGDFGEPMLPHGVAHYRFSTAHSHPGILWAGDRHARVAWRDHLRSRYRDLADLNAAWGTAFAAWGDDLMAGLGDGPRVGRARRLDYLEWVAACTARFNAEAYRLVRRHLPWARTAIPVGGPDEADHGQLKSRCLKEMAAVDRACLVRWTGINFFRDAARSHVLAARMSSAARFYGLAFGEEAELYIEPAHAVAGIYEGIANGASMWHNDIGNIRRSLERPAVRGLAALPVDPPVREVAVFYPAEQEMIEAFDTDFAQPWSSCPCLRRHAERGADLRRRTDYAVCDSLMVADGFLHGLQALVFLDDLPVPAAILPALAAFVAGGGRIILACAARVQVLEDGSPLASRVAVEPCDGLPRFPAREALVHTEGELVTVHERHVSRFDPRRDAIEITERPAPDELSLTVIDK